MPNIAYIRVSTAEQNDTRQYEALQQYQIDRWYVEKASAKNMDRPQLMAMLDYVREGDTIFVHDLSRLARSVIDLLALMERLEKEGIHIRSHKECLDTSTAAGKLILSVLAAISQFERDNLLERQREGIHIAKEQGKYKGKRRIAIPNINRWYERFETGQTSKAQLCRELGISRPTLDRLFREYEETMKGS